MSSTSSIQQLKKSSDDKMLILYAESMEDLAKEIAELYPDSFEVGEISWKKFPDGFPNIHVPVKQIKHRNVVFLSSMHFDGDIFDQFAVLYALPKYLARSVHLVLPFFPTATMERVMYEGEIATAKTLSRMISCTPVSPGGPTRLTVFDLHTLQGRFYFDDNVIPILETAIPLLHEQLEKLKEESEDELAIAFPDDGAAKRFGTFFDGFELVVCVKKRVEDKRIVTIKDGNPEGKHVVIVDDLVQTGGTLVQCSKAIKEAGASKVSAYCTHAVFPGDAWTRFVEEDIFDTFWVTNSNPRVLSSIRGQKPFEVLSIAPLVAQSLYDQAI